MTWVRLEDNFPEHPKIAALDPEAAWLFVQGLCYANRNLTDGFIPARAARSMAGSRHRSLTGSLVAEKLWETERGGYRIHDYLDYQPAKARVTQSRADARNRMVRLREVRTNNDRTSGEVRLPRTQPRTQVSKDTSTPREGFEDARVRAVLEGTRLGRMA